VVTFGHVTKMVATPNTIRSAITKNLMLHANFTAVSSIEPNSYYRSKFYIANMQE